MKLSNYFRQLKKFSVALKQFHLQRIKNPSYYYYLSKIFINFLVLGLFKNSFQITFGSDYLKHVPRYIFKDLPYYCKNFIEYHFNMFYYNKIKHEQVQFLPPIKPLSPKLSANHICVDESTLEDVAKLLDFKIVDEKLFSLKSIYTLTIKND